MPPPRDLSPGQIAFNNWIAKNQATQNASSNTPSPSIINSIIGGVGDLGKKAWNSQFIQGANPDLVSNPNELQSPGLAYYDAYNFLDTNRNADIGRAVAPADEYNLQSPEEWASSGYVSPDQAAAEYGGQFNWFGGDTFVGRQNLSTGVGTQTPEMPTAIVGQNPTGMGPDGSYGWDIATQSAKAGAPGLEPGGMTTEGEETVIDWATPAINYGYSYNPADRANYYSTTNNATYGDSATDIEGAEEDDLRALALDPLNRGLGPIHGAYAERFNKGPSKAAEYLGLGPGSTYANLAAADHYADQGPEGWVQSDFVGNYNPLEAAGAQMHAVGSEAPSGGFSLGDVGGFLGGLFRY